MGPTMNGAGTDWYLAETVFAAERSGTWRADLAFPTTSTSGAVVRGRRDLLNCRPYRPLRAEMPHRADTTRTPPPLRFDNGRVHRRTRRRERPVGRGADIFPYRRG